jgi:hypothetical protein
MLPCYDKEDSFSYPGSASLPRPIQASSMSSGDSFSGEGIYWGFSSPYSKYVKISNIAGVV